MKRVKQGVTYDDGDVESIVSYARQIEDKSLRQVLEIEPGISPKGSSTGSKGKMGDNVEEYYFDIRNNSEQRPDFPKVGVELKTTGLKYTSKGEMKAKERLSITSINWMTILDETFESSHLMDKIRSVLLMAYDYDANLDLFDMIFRLVALWHVPDADKPQLRDDWDIVLAKVRAGKADEVSGSDTMYLEAATTGSGHGVVKPQPCSSTQAKPRRWALKPKYMTTVINELFERRQYARIHRDEGQEGLALRQLVKRRFDPYMNRTREDLKGLLGIECSVGAKQFTSELTKRILGVGTDASIEEFEKAGVISRTIRQSPTGYVKESVSFPAMDYRTIANTKWEDSRFHEEMTSPFLFVVFKEDDAGEYRLHRLVWWTPTEDDVYEAHEVFEETKRLIRANVYDKFPGIKRRDGTKSHVHVRPHGTKNETCETPAGGREGKKSFWITNTYIRQIIGDD